ncbi:uncharacterized protein LOC126573002 [Anopheles aquasalis]|uniref:uncharacterized protein LOC126573002 n=1 Tax=Anopheles aquasalis TaxID=42839 RepID=UPI00215AD846|nr:uncharacterized protein LOC126573002 [Anopheles aquasalis]
MVWVWLWLFGACQHPPPVEAVSGLYVNNQRLEQGTDSWRHEVAKGELLTKANFSGSDPAASWIQLYWDRNATPVRYADDLASIKNTLHDTHPTYIGDALRPSTNLPATLSTVPGFPSTTQATPSKQQQQQHPPRVRKRTRTTRKPPPTPSPVNKKNTALTPELMALLQRYYSFSCTLVPKRNQVPLNTGTTRRTPVATSAPTRPRKPTKRRTKPTVATVYVTPPVIKRLGGMLESVYNFMENALTSTEIERAATNPPTPAPGTRKVKRNTGTELPAPGIAYTATPAPAPAAESRTDSGEGGGWGRFTAAAADRVTIAGLPAVLTSGSDGNKNKMTTNIQVTSEYTAATPPTGPLAKPNRVVEDDSSESDESADYYGGFDDDEDDDEDDSDEDEGDEEGGEAEAIQPNRRRRPTVSINDKDYDELGPSETGNRRPIRKRRRRRRKPPTTTTSGSYENSADGSSYEDDDDEEEDDEEEDEYSAKDDRLSSSSSEEEEEDEPPGFLSGMFATFSRFVRSLGFGGTVLRAGGDVDEDRGRSTTPRVLAARKRPTRSTTADSHRFGSVATVPSRHAPFPPFLLNELDESVVDHEEPTTTTTTTTPPEGPSGGMASWFAGLMMPSSWDVFNPWGTGDWEPSEAQQQQQQVEESSSWFAQWFGGAGGGDGNSGTTSTQSPPNTTTSGPAVVQLPEHLLSALTQYVVHGGATTRPPRRRSYAGYQLWRLTVQTVEQLRALTDYRRSPAGLELRWWIGPSVRGLTDVLVPPTGPAQSRFRGLLRDAGIGYRVTIGDVGRAMAYENPRTTRRDQLETELRQGHPLTWYRYHRYADIAKFLGTLHRQHGARVQLLHVGRSYEGRPLTVVRVSFAQPTGRPGRPGRPGRRPAIFIEAGVQGRDWIGPAVATWLLNRLVELPAGGDRRAGNGTQQPEEGGGLESVQSYDWYVLPVLNPDGYEYSHEHDRMWAKSRRNASEDDDPEPGVLASALASWWPRPGDRASGDSSEGRHRCTGVNLDRNWGHRWGEGSGASRSRCSEDYAGPAPFSEPETRSVRDFLLGGGGGRSRRNVRLYLSLRSYGQALSYPTPAEEAPEANETERDEDVHEMGSVGLDALRGSADGNDPSVPYRLVPGISTVGGAASGTAVEYARYGAGIRYAYTVRLPDTGTHGFLLPPSSIVSTGRDLFELIKGMIEYS